MIFDSHAHYDDEQFDCDREELLDSMQEHGIGGIINVGASMEGVFASQELAEKYRAELIEHVAEQDDELLEKYLGGEELTVDEIKRTIRKT